MLYWGGGHGDDAGFFCGFGVWKDWVAALCALKKATFGESMFVHLMLETLNETVIPCLQAENDPLPLCLRVSCITCICILTYFYDNKYT